MTWTKGTVSIDGVDVRDATIESVRDALALVSQEAVLFDESVRANIAYGRTGASDDDIEAAARAAGAARFIEELPDGYDTIIGEHGVKLSGGQRQRLSIARAMLKDAPILLLDEATSALDAESERQVQDALRSLMQGRTTLVIAHRLSTVREANRIYVLENGRLAGNGHAPIAVGGERRVRAAARRAVFPRAWQPNRVWHSASASHEAGWGVPRSSGFYAALCEPRLCHDPLADSRPRRRRSADARRSTLHLCLPGMAG